MLRPLKRRELIRRLRRFGFKGPFAGSKHQFMNKAAHKVRIPNPHQSDVGIGLLRDILRQAQIQEESW